MSAQQTLDLDAASRDALELDAVLAYVASFAVSAIGRIGLRAAGARTSMDELAGEHAANSEAARHLERFGRILADGIPDPEPALAALAVEGRVVDPLRLRDLASVLLHAADARRRLGGIEEEGFDRLKATGRGIPDVSALAHDVARHVAPDGRIEDGASPELRRVRVAIVTTGERLRRQLESFVHDPAAASIVRDEFVTQRNGRFVIPVRADSPRAVDGIVHAASSSGQTLFVEPIESVPLNNELVRLSEQEAVEQERVMRGWMELFRSRSDEIKTAVDGLCRADMLQAKALFGVHIEGCSPVLDPDAPLSLDAVRHPLLDRRLKDQGGRCVPVTIAIDPHDRVLVISGPNAGGKTVVLKTMGLACVMAQCGLPVAAAAASLPVFRQVRADIGDHQSIDADLSTFSAHVRAVGGYLEAADPPALFLFDEIGTGTEPGEGAALAQAVLERVLTLGVTAIATTHHAGLKAWAFAASGVASAAMEFDDATLRPTYRVLAGAAGTSAGIEVASKLGFDRELVARARELVGIGGRNAEASMARLRDLTTEAEARVERLERAEEALAVARASLEATTRDETARRREEVRSSLAAALEEFREQSRSELAAIHDAKERMKVERAQRSAETRLRASLREKQDALAPESSVGSSLPFAIAPGVKARILSLDREGEIVGVRGDKIDVRMGAATFTVARRDVAASASELPPLAAKPGTGNRPTALAASARSTLTGAPAAGPPMELHVLGHTVDEALPTLDRFLDASVREGRTEVRVVHGHGTGRLRLAVRAYLKGHAHVDAFRPGGAGEGGDGATIVTLR